MDLDYSSRLTFVWNCEISEEQKMNVEMRQSHKIDNNECDWHV